MEYNLCTATGVWKDLITARFGSDVTLRTKLGYFMQDGILDPNYLKNENYTINKETAVAQWLRCCVTNR